MYPDMHIADGPLMRIPDSLAPDSKDLAAVGSGWNFKFCESLDGRHLNFTAQDGDIQGNGLFAQHVGVLSFKDGMGSDMHDDEQIAVRSAARAGLPFPGQSQA